MWQTDGQCNFYRTDCVQETETIKKSGKGTDKAAIDMGRQVCDAINWKKFELQQK